jgi:hypothetical protein
MADSSIMPRYPVYILSKGRYQIERAFTARQFVKDKVPFTIAVETPEVEVYQALCKALGVPTSWVADIGFSNLGQGCSSVRNWISDHAKANGFEREWQFDDNDYGFYRVYKGKRVPCRGGLAMRVCEDFTDRYENVGLSGLNYDMFGVRNKNPFNVNCHVYSATLHNTAMPFRWRGPYNEDTDMCLQVLSGGWCTITLNSFLVKKKAAFKKAGVRNIQGGMSSVYEGDGRLKMARQLERQWPYVVETGRRFQRPQHIVKDSWKRFDTPLRRKPDVDLAALPAVDEYGMRLDRVAEPRSPRIRALAEGYGE